MQQHGDDSKFIPLFVEKGKTRTIQKIRFSYSFLSNLATANRLRFFLFSNEGQGYKQALSYSHNRHRFRSKKRLIAVREKAQQFNEVLKLKQKSRREAIIALKYGKKYGTLNIGTIQKCREAGIKMRSDKRILPYALFRRQLNDLFSSEMNGK